jgi:5'-nucleotidase
MKPRILLVNDDGIFAPGLKHLWRAVVDFADVTIVAPSSERSGAGTSLTLKDPIHIDEVKWESGTPAFKVSGTPADCVRLAASVILDQKPDLILSGINKGSNSGRTLFYSGTVGGVIEGVIRNIPGVAFSSGEFENPNYALAEKHIPAVVRHLLEHPLPAGTLLNVNFPESVDAIKGFKLARQGKGYWMEDPDHRTHPEGHSYYWLGGKWSDHEEEEESDVALLRQGYMTAVPVHIHELTHHAFLESRKAAFEDLRFD